MRVGPDNVHVGYQAAFAPADSDTDAVVATDLATGDEVWRWAADAAARYGSSSDEPLAVLALSRENGTERLHYTGVQRTEGSGTQRATAVLRTTVLDAATGAVLGRGEAPLPKELAVIDDTTDCEFDQVDVVVCSGMRSTVGLDATTARQLWRLPDDAAGRVDPGLDAAFHGRVYALDVILDARTGEDVVPSLSVTADTVVPGYAITRSGGEAVAHRATS
ncbi:hypothetical protein ACQPYE_26110 [Actinosynnema sp. CA-299493]